MWKTGSYNKIKMGTRTQSVHAECVKELAIIGYPTDPMMLTRNRVSVELGRRLSNGY